MQKRLALPSPPKREGIAFYDKLSERAFSLIERGIKTLGFPQMHGLFDGKIAVSSAQFLTERCSSYLEEISLFNGVFGLVSSNCSTAKGREDAAVRHVLDSIAPWRELVQMLIACNPGRDFASNPLRICDAGSGAGLPGIPLALIFPQAQFTLVERMQKRAAFLQNCAASLSLNNVFIENREIERLRRGAFDVIVLRAFRPLYEEKILNTLLSLLRPLGGPGTAFITAYKGRRSTFAAEEQKMRDDGFLGKIETRDIAVPFLGEERLVAFIFAK